jgi:hypothetical protein
MEMRAYAHPYEPINVDVVAALDDACLARQPLENLYHMAADLDAHAWALERDCEALWSGMQVRAELIALLESLGLYPARLAELREAQRIDAHNRLLGVRMRKAAEVQQSRVQWAIIHKDPCRYGVYEG